MTALFWSYSYITKVRVNCQEEKFGAGRFPRFTVSVQGGRVKRSGKRKDLTSSRNFGNL